MRVGLIIAIISAFMLAMPFAFSLTPISYDFEEESDIANFVFNESAINLSISDAWSKEGSYSLIINWSNLAVASQREMPYDSNTIINRDEHLNFSVNLYVSDNVLKVPYIVLFYNETSDTFYTLGISDTSGADTFRLIEYNNGVEGTTHFSDTIAAIVGKNVTIKGFWDTNGTYDMDIYLDDVLTGGGNGVESTITEGKFGFQGYTTVGAVNKWKFFDNITFYTGGYFTEAGITINLESPSDNFRDHVDPTNFTFNVTNADNSTVPCDLYIDDVKNATNNSVANHTTSVFSVSMSDGSHTWYVNCSDLDETETSSTWTYIADYTQPVINSVTPVSANTTIFTGFNMTFEGNVTDDSVYRVNRTIYYPNGTVFYNNYSGDLSNGTTSYSWDITFNTTDEPNGVWDYYIQSSDSHTKGSLHNLLYEIQTNGINFFTDNDQSFMQVGYINNDEFHAVTQNQINNFNIDFTVVKLEGEYKFALRFDRPAQDFKFGFLIKKLPNLILYNPDIAHFIWKRWYIDFEDWEDNGFPIGVAQNDTHYFVWTNSQFCPNPVGERCVLDPAIGGLNENELEIEFQVNNCVPSWSCSDYGVCNSSNLAPCNDTTDLNACGLPYGGVYSEFSAQGCDYCYYQGTFSDATDTCGVYGYLNTTHININWVTCCNVTKLHTDCRCNPNGSMILTGDEGERWGDCRYIYDDYGQDYLDFIDNVTWTLEETCYARFDYSEDDIEKGLLNNIAKVLIVLAWTLPILIIIGLSVWGMKKVRGKK